MRFARTYVRDRAVAEEVVQETWLAVLDGIDRFEGRSSLRTWIFQILSNRARTRAVRERRSAPFSSLAGDGEDGEAAVDADRFRDESHRPVHGRPELDQVYLARRLGPACVMRQSARGWCWCGCAGRVPVGWAATSSSRP
jgi:RNA polymerase sigma factor (sigma-70 family)